ncbi:hypothetical protein HDV01_000247 [Terramyces sp. JEL0728]|nr:hypothetical protein HDV01_000247 [Terramyces sp. JEL0728]
MKEQPKKEEPKQHGFCRNIFLNFILPSILYSILIHHVSNVAAILISASFPVIQFVTELYKTKEIDWFSLVVVTSTVITAIIAAASQNPNVADFKDSIQNYLLSVSMFFSSYCRVDFLGHYYSKDRVFEDLQNKEQLQEDYENIPNVLTQVWTVAFFLEASINLILAFTVPNILVFIVPALTVIVMSVLSLVYKYLVSKVKAEPRESTATIDTSSISQE